MAVETASDRDYACFHCGAWKSKDKLASCPTCGLPLNAGSTLKGSTFSGYTLDEYVDRGYYGATFRATNRIKKEFAIKICPQVLYNVNEKDFGSEIERYQKLGAHPNIAELVDAGAGEITLGKYRIPAYFVVMEWIKGVAFGDFIARKEFTVPEMYGVIVDIASGVSRFESRNLWHNDLNADNIRVKELSPEELEGRRPESRYICKIVDSGSAVFRQSEQHKRLDDVRFLAQHINAMRLALCDQPMQLTKEDRFFLDEVVKVIARALDEDPTRSVNVAQTLLDEVKALYQRRLILEEEIPVTLDDPFAYLNANDFPRDVFVSMLFSARFPWLQSVTSSEAGSMLITGPRGCGKTMILKSLRLKTRIQRRSANESDNEIKSRLVAEKLVGFFVSARIEIGNNCPLTKLPKWASSEEQVNLYFNLLYTYEILSTLQLATLKGITEISDDAEREICRFISSSLSEGDFATFTGLMSSLQALQRRIMLDRVTGAVSAQAIGPTFLTELVKLLKGRIPFLASKHIVFLLDDFSLPKVPVEVQKILLPTIWNLGGGYSFRVTAHSDSVSEQDLKKIPYQSNREYKEVNLGASYINNLEQEHRLEVIKGCINEIFEKRFSLSKGYDGVSLGKALGPAPKEQIGRRIRRLAKERKLHTLRFYGWDTLIRLCSGDISYVIDLVRNILRDKPSRYPVNVNVQSREIKQYARANLYKLQDYQTDWCDLYEVALNFGKFSRYKLERGPTVGADKRPAEYLRLEVETDRMTPRAKRALSDLLRNGVFIDGEFSNSSRGTPARRLIFKKLFTPVFPTTYMSRDTWPMSAAHFEEFILDPKRYVKQKMGEDGVPPEQQSLALDQLIEPLQEG